MHFLLPEFMKISQSDALCTKTNSGKNNYLEGNTTIRELKREAYGFY